MKNVKRNDNLVFIKGTEPITINHTVFEPNTHYRSITLSESKDNVQTLVFGEVFHFEEFQKIFEYVTERVLNHWVDLGLLKLDSNGIAKPISFTAFGKLADIHEYGRGKNKMRILYFMRNRDAIYGFYPCNYTKINDIRESYQMFLDTVGGEFEHLADKSIQFGNCGIPLSYGYLRENKIVPKAFIL